MKEDTPWHRGLKRRKPAYQRQEEEMAKRPGARKQPNSGRMWSARGDVLQSFSDKLTRLLIDNKGPTEKRSYTITRDDWLELRAISNGTPPGCQPALQISLQDVHLMTMELPFWDHVVDYIIHLESLIEQLQEQERVGSDSN